MIHWQWDFGDGSSDTTRHPRHHYARAGSYRVCLQVIDGKGGRDTLCDSITVKPRNCEAAFAMTPTANTYEISVVDRSHGEGKLTYRWNFDDQFFSSDPQAVRNFRWAGNYPVCLQIRDTAGCHSKLCDTAVFCRVSFDHLRSLKHGLTGYTFNGKSGQFLNYWKWNFDDGSTSRNKGLVHRLPGL